MQLVNNDYQELRQTAKAMVIGSANYILHSPRINAGITIDDNFEGNAVDLYVDQIMSKVTEIISKMSKADK